MHKKYLGYIVALALWLPTNLLSQAIDQERGTPFVTHYPVKEYGGHPQNWAIAQDSKGLMYFGNQGEGVLQFDGVSWRQIPVPNGRVQSLAIDENDRVFIGGYNHFGYLAPDSAGTYEYVSLLTLLDELQRELQDVMKIFPTGKGVFFQARNRLLFVTGDSVQTWEPETVFNESFLIDSKLHVQQMNIGLMVLKDGELKLAPAGEQFADEEITSILSFDNHRHIVATTKSLSLYDGKHVSPFHTNADELLTNILHGAILPDSTFAYATSASGIVVITRTGKIRRIIDRTSGLKSDTAVYLYVDRHNSLWATVGSGIARIKYPAALLFYDGEKTPVADVIDATRHKGVLYVSNSSGIFRLRSRNLVKHEKPTRLQYAEFEPVLPEPMECRSLLSFGPHLLAGTAKGIFAINGQQVQQIVNYNLKTYALYRSKRDSHRVFVGTYNGLASFRQSPDQPGLWCNDGLVAGLTGFARSLLEDPDGKLWVGSDYSGIRRVDFSTGFTNTPSVQSFGEDDGLPTGVDKGDVQVFPVAGRPLFATDRGLFRFDQTAGRFNPEPAFGAGLANNRRKVWTCVEDSRGNVFFDVEHQFSSVYALSKYTPEHGYHYTERPFRTLTHTPSDLIFPDVDGSCWLGTDEALINYDPALERDSTTGFSTLIRRVLARGDSVVFGGAAMRPSNLVPGHMTENDINPYPTFGYEGNSFRFEFAATSYEKVNSNRYQFFLQGIEDSWLKWNHETHKDYTHLPPGDYVFWVRAQNVYGEVSDPVNYGFMILPPWYQTWPAYLVWLVLFLSSIIALVKVQVTRARKIEHAKSEQREQIRKEMAADFHDGAGDKLAQISLFSKFVQSKIKDGSEETQNALRWTVEAADALKLETRDFIWALDTGHDSFRDVADRIVSHGKDLFRRAQPLVAFDAHGLSAELKAVPLHLEWKRNLIFIFKEGLNNVFKYSNGSVVEVSFKVSQGIIYIELKDNGTGFATDSEFKGRGLRNMRNRAKKLGADLTIDSQPGTGTIIQFKGRLNTS